MKFLFDLFFNFLIVSFSLLQVASAQDVNIQLGQEIFSQKCVGCHAGGENLINPLKPLKIEALESFGMDSIDAIVKQVTNGNPAGMPPFAGSLSDDEIVSVANYVLSQAKQEAW
uniref:Cytochrome c-553 n=1 Tax=Dasyclonium flaccidum TaxID=2007274 RepID=A0A1Z1MKC3_9FLOR|nr:cytochrome c553 [Dasyclonium flaccidum]ARW66540.1 cytochrome c553 [Dasyclonium flaccidum]